MKRAIATVLFIGVIAVVGYFVSQKQRETRWEKARAEMNVQFTEALQEAFGDLDFDPSINGTIADCTASKLIEFLNDTECEYEYDANNVSREQHLASQATCFESVGYDDKELEAMILCTRESMPNEWKVMRPRLLAEFKEAFSGQGLDAATTSSFATCMVDKVVETLTGSACPLINPAGTTADDLLNTVDGCIEKHAAIKTAMDTAIEGCKPGGSAPEPTPAAPSPPAGEPG